jgi:hypothetical protein
MWKASLGSGSTAIISDSKGTFFNEGIFLAFADLAVILKIEESVE